MKNSKPDPSKLEDYPLISPLPIESCTINDQAALQDQFKPEDRPTTAPIFAFLPIELSQPIIDNLSDDPAALRACSLTCRAFLHASRHHIFYSICLASYRQARRFLDKICFTDSPTSPCTYVRSLRMFEGEDWPSPFVNKTLPLLATRLLNVTKLELNNLNWTILEDAGRAKILSGFPNVQRLRMRAFFETSQQANEFISSFPSLTTLTCWKAAWKSYSEPVIPLPQRLRFIASCSSQSTFFTRLLRLEPQHCVSTVCFRMLFLEDAQTVGELLKTLGSRLEHLEFVNIDNIVPRGVYKPYINLAHNTNLRSICLDLLSVSSQDIPTAVDRMSTLFSQITSPHMEHVSLLIPPGSRLRETSWASIENIFTQQHWPKLRLLEIVGLGETDVERVSIKARFPTLDSHGIVQVTGWLERNLDNSAVFLDGF